MYCILFITFSSTLIDDNLTSAFVETVRMLLLSSACRVMVLAVEKRICFTLGDLAPAAPAYDHLSKIMLAHTDFECRRIDLDSIPQVVQYVRTAELELWSVTLK